MTQFNVLFLAFCLISVTATFAFVNTQQQQHNQHKSSPRSFSTRTTTRRLQPSSTTTSLNVIGVDKFDMDELKDRINAMKNPYAQLFDIDWTKRELPDTVHCILFNPGTDEEGIHTIEYPKGSGSNVLLAFESAKDCAYFAADLKEQKFFDPSPQMMELSSLEDYCEQLGVFVQVVPGGYELKPPQARRQVLGNDHKLRENQEQLDRIFDLVSDDDDIVHDHFLEEDECSVEGVGCWE
eukprot:CAMPEP_0194041804 /NCGR_PEP_ID=MMETSP0009_2-20130614/13628_1 /TAXON_ID=210454 /ORGANISM="Grammatophora oceanica, Strain CCMP 410" /LENGTH=237 /DNA_ID=CAMNT_0038685413 /DNA_START=204 /DNA_END=917 /DNA_ORIENTATION=+